LEILGFYTAGVFSEYAIPARDDVPARKGAC